LRGRSVTLRSPWVPIGFVVTARRSGRGLVAGPGGSRIPGGRCASTTRGWAAWWCIAPDVNTDKPVGQASSGRKGRNTLNISYSPVFVLMSTHWHSRTCFMIGIDDSAPRATDVATSRAANPAAAAKKSATSIPARQHRNPRSGNHRLGSDRGNAASPPPARVADHAPARSSPAPQSGVVTGAGCQ